MASNFLGNVVIARWGGFARKAVRVVRVDGLDAISSIIVYIYARWVVLMNFGILNKLIRFFTKKEEPMILPLKQERFNLYSLGAKSVEITLISDELSWWKNKDETLIGVVLIDYTDSDYVWIIMARDKIGRFRCSHMDTGIETRVKAEEELKAKMKEVSESADFNGIIEQGDEPEKAIDLLSIAAKVDKSKLHPYFINLIDSEHAQPARKVISEISKWMFPADKHFVNEFQRFQFDQRIWEIYLWATFRELGYNVIQHEAPDFECKNFLANFLVEATTIAPSQGGVLAKHPNPSTIKEHQEFLDNYMPMKVGSALTSKLTKRNAQGDAYWEMPHVKDKPFILAVEDFHKAANLETGELGSMIYSQGALYIYLYGKRVNWEIKEDGSLHIETASVEEHQYEDKTIPSGFFDLEGAENISAILFLNAGTFSKFTRMGVCAGFSGENFKYFRTGTLFNPDPDAVVGIPFSMDVQSEDYSETWHDELQLFHNPNAKHPIDPKWFPDIAQHYFKDGKLYTIDSAYRVLSSFTTNMKITSDVKEKV